MHLCTNNSAYTYEIENKKKLTTVFFKSSSGKEPVHEWLLGLSKEQKKLIGGDIKTVEYGWPMGDRLFEVRTELENTVSGVIVQNFGRANASFASHLSRSASFDISALERAIELFDSGKTSAVKFHEDVFAAGVILCSVFLSHQRIIYLGVDGRTYREDY